MYILGIDPGYAIMGYAVVKKSGSGFEAVDYGVLSTSKDMSTPDRLKQLYSEMMEIISKYSPEEASIEKLYFNTNAKTIIGVSEARGVALLACANSGLRIFEYTPLQIKQAMTGSGRADKKQLQAMTARMLGLSEVPKPDDAADALAAALCHSFAGEARKRLYELR